MALLCPGCGKAVSDRRIERGDRFECKRCAGLLLEVVYKGGRPALRQVPFASCPICEASLEIPEGVEPGEEVKHCGKTFRLTYAFGAYALEPISKTR